jgi:hypothetical protein
MKQEPQQWVYQMYFLVWGRSEGFCLECRVKWARPARKVIGTGAQGLTSATQRYAPLYNTGMLVASAKTQANQVYKLNDQAIENLYRKVDEDMI